MIVRALDAEHDWLFGKGQNDYKRGNAAVAQNIDTRLNMFLNDCFFDFGAGIDWFNLLGGKNLIAVKLAISAQILNTQFVTGILQLKIPELDANRFFTVQYQVQTSFSQVFGTFQYDLGGGID